jgi:hypothetical protein
MPVYQNFGTLSPDVVAVATLGFIRQNFPILTAVASDFSDQDVKLNASLITRIVNVPEVQSFSKQYGYAAGSGGTTDVKVTMDNFRYVTLSFYDDDMSSTSRNLVAESAEAAAYALAKDAADSLMDLATPANFPNHIVSSGADFDRATLASLRAQLVSQGAGLPRSVIVSPSAFESLSQDVTILSKWNQNVTDSTTNYGMDAEINGIGGFNSVMEYANLTVDDANLTGFGFAKNALIVVGRVPTDPSQYIEGVPQNAIIRNISDPLSGLTVQYRAEYHASLGRLDVILAWIFGVGVGAPFDGVLVTGS